MKLFIDWSAMGERPGTFRRKGQVRAHRLTNPVAWTTARGDLLRGRVGDWWVTSQDGAVRSVTPEEFASSYVHIEGDRYERFGLVQARKVNEMEVIQTLEGNATAQAGDWIVTGPNGSSWPVTDQMFHAGYESVP